MGMETILIVDDEAPQRKVLAGFLSKKGFQVEAAGNAAEGIAIFEKDRVDLVLTDYRMPGGTGLDVLLAVRRINPNVPLILITAYGSIDGAVEAMQDGAFDYITKPINLKRLEQAIRRGLQQRTMQIENQRLVDHLDVPSHLDGFVSESSRMQEALSIAARAAASNATVLILGETGTGKEVIARAVHRASGRKAGAFLAVNCAALAEGLLESELFGHEKGAFTGADVRRLGRFEEADGGTLLLDELGDISTAMQVKLLRVLQEGEFQRVGSSRTIRTDVRVIGATHRDLAGMVKVGSFREDLFYRLNVIAIRVPPLRERREDIPALAEGFLAYYAERNGRKLGGIAREAMDLLVRHSYPGNVRELENAIERAVVMARGSVLDAADLPEAISGKGEGRKMSSLPSAGSLPDRLETMEREAIQEAMEQAGGVQSRAARLLGMNERNLRYKLKKYGLK